MKPADKTLYVCSAVCALIMLDTNVVAVSLPAIARSLKASFADVEWVVSAYMLAFASCLLPAGGIADRLGRRRVMLWGLALFALASLLCGAAWTPFVLNLARAVKGLGAALLLTSALAVISHTFQGEAERARAWSIWGAAMGVAMTVAPLLGGLLTSALGWRWIFYLNLPVVAILMLLVSKQVTESRNPASAKLDPLGAALFSGALFCLIWGLIDGAVARWASAATITRFVLAALLLLAFVLVEKRGQSPMLDLSLFGRRAFVGAVLGMLGYAVSAQVMMTFLPLYLQNAFSYSAVLAGGAMLPFAVAMVLASRLAPLLAHRLHDRGMLVTGLLIVAIGNALTALAAASLAYGSVALGMVVTGAGAGLLNGTTQKAILASIARERSGMGSGISTTTRFTGIVLAVAGLGAVLAQRTGAAFERLAWLHGVQTSPDMVGRIVAGNAMEAFAQLPPAMREVAAAAARQAFVEGFAGVLWLASALASLSAALVLVLARPVSSMSLPEQSAAHRPRR